MYWARLACGGQSHPGGDLRGMSGDDWAGLSAFGGVADARRRLATWTRLSRQARTPQDRQINSWQAAAGETIFDDALAVDAGPAVATSIARAGRARVEEWRRLAMEAPTEWEREKSRWQATAGEEIVGYLASATGDVAEAREHPSPDQTQLRD